MLFSFSGRPHPGRLLRVQQHHHQRRGDPGLRAPPVLHPGLSHAGLDVRGADPGQERVRLVVGVGQVPVLHQGIR